MRWCLMYHDACTDSRVFRFLVDYCSVKLITIMYTRHVEFYALKEIRTFGAKRPEHVSPEHVSSTLKAAFPIPCSSSVMRFTGKGEK